MVCHRFTKPGANITGDTDLDRYLALSELLDQFRILRGCESVADALSFEVERAPDRLWSRSFARMRGQMQSLIGGVREYVAKEFRRTFAFVAADTESDNIAIAIACREFRNSPSRVSAKLPDRIEDPEQRDAKIALASYAAPVETL